MAKSAGIPNKTAPDAPVAPINSNGWYGVLLILAVTSTLYFPSLKNGFTNWDDDVYVTANEHLRWSAENLKTLATKEVAGNFHPLTMWSLSFDRGSGALKQPDPAPFHRSNLLLHLLNSVLVFLLIRRLKAGVLVAAATALLFAVHPMHVESVAWVSGRKDVLYTAFFLAGLMAYTQYLDKQKISWITTAFVLFVLSCLSKPAAIVFPAAAWLLHWYLRPETAWNRATWLRFLPFILVSAVFSYLTVVYQQKIGAVDVQYSFLQRSLFAAYAYVTYLWKLALPIHLSAFHPAPLANESLGAMFYAAVPVALAVLAAMFYAYKKQRDLFFALAFYTVNVALVLGFIKVGSALTAERYTYVSYLGLFMLIGSGLEYFAGKGDFRRLAALAVFLFFFAYWYIASLRQIPVWRDSETLWTQIVDQYPTEKCLSYRGYHRYLQQQWTKALEDFNRSYALNPNNATTVHIRAICFNKAGDVAASLQAYEEYERNFPPNGDVELQHATLLNEQKRISEAIPHFEKGLSLQPQNIDGWTNLSTAYFAEKQPQKAEYCCTKALEINPKFIIALNNRGALRLTMGNYQGAIEDLSQSLALNPNQPQAYQYRGICYERTGQDQAAAADKAALAKFQK